MNEWLIEPRDPLIARDGRPARLGGSLASLGFPYPSMLAGAVRTRLASAGGSFKLTPPQLAELTRIAVHGPLLAELAVAAETVARWLAPAPRDAVVTGDGGGQVAIERLLPRPGRSGTLIDGLPEKGLLPVRPAAAAGAGAGRAKPSHDAPAYWPWERFESWLTEPHGELVEAAELGIGPLPVERRWHLALQPGQRVGIDGMLFESAGLRFLQPGRDGRRLAPRRLALSVRCGGGEVGGQPLALVDQLAALGGERRLARWRRSPAPWPLLPAAVRQRIVDTRRARLILLTPALLAGGALPGWNGQPSPWQPGVAATVRAACVGRPEIGSGWDLAIDNGPGKPRGGPKRTRRLAAAGSVYFLDLQGEREDVGAWCDAAWLSCVSDAEQDRRDGFGLAVVGTWEEP